MGMMQLENVTWHSNYCPAFILLLKALKEETRDSQLSSTSHNNLYSALLHSVQEQMIELVQGGRSRLMNRYSVSTESDGKTQN